MPKILIFALLVCTAIGRGDPCRFVGARFAKVASSCNAAGICTNFRLFEKMYQPVSDIGAPVLCSEAMEVMESVLANFKSLEPFNKRPRQEVTPSDAAVDILTKLRSVIIPEFRKMIFTETPAPSSVIDVMREIDTSLLTLFSQGLVAPHIAESWEISEIKYCMLLLHLKTDSAPFSFDVASNKTACFGHFVLDLISVGCVRSGIFNLASRFALAHNPVHHRLPYPREIERVFSCNWINDPDVVVRFAGDIERGGTLMSTLSIPVRVVNELAEFITVKWLDDVSARVLLLFTRIRFGLCKRLAPIFLSSPQVYSRERRSVLTLIHFCRDQIESRDLLNMSLLLGPADGHASASSDSSDWDRTNADLVTNMLHDAKTKWIQGNSGVSMPWACSTVLTILVDYIERFKPLQDRGRYSEFSTVENFDSRTEFRSTMRGFGRALGLAFRHSCPIGPFLNLIPELFEAIHTLPEPDFPFYTQQFLSPIELRSDVAARYQALEKRVFEPIFFIRWGFQDVVGPVGPLIYSKSEWLGYRQFQIESAKTTQAAYP